MFPGIQQKERSRFLTKLWNADTYKGEWEFLAKIYSYIRNEACKDSPTAKIVIRTFLNIACPIMHMVPVENYLVTFKWQLISVGDGQHELNQYAKPLIQKATPSMNGFDLLCLCLANGYEVHNGHNILYGMIGTPENLITTASFAAAPAAPAAPLGAGTFPATSFKDEFLTMIAKNPLFATSMIVQDTVSHKPQEHGVNVIRVHDINQVPDHMIRERGSTHCQQAQTYDAIEQQGNGSGFVDIGSELEAMGSDGGNGTASTMADRETIGSLNAEMLETFRKRSTFSTPAWFHH